MLSSAREYYNALNLWRLPRHRGHLRVTDYLKNGGTIERAAHGEPCYAALLLLDEARHAAPASGSRYAIDSLFTRAIRGLAERFGLQQRLLSSIAAFAKTLEVIEQGSCMLTASPKKSRRKLLCTAAARPRTSLPTK